MTTATCAECGNPFPATRSTATYCSPGCRQKSYRNRNSVTATVTVSDPVLPKPRAKRRPAKPTGHAERLYVAMRNAPPGAISLPMMNRASKALDTLDELSVLDPRTAASQVPAVRCREYSGDRALAEWLLMFIEACDERRQTETPDLGHLRRYNPLREATDDLLIQ